MKKNPSLKLNFIMNIILTASAFLFPVVTSPYVSRILLPEGTGRIAFASSIISYFALVARLGIPTYGIRACAQVQDDSEELTRTAQEIFIINLIMTFGVYLVFFASLFFISQFRQDQSLLLVISSTMILNLLGMEWLYKALEQYLDITVRSLIFNLGAVLLTFLLVRTKEDFVIYGGITVLASVGSNILNFVFVRKYISFAPCRPYHFARHLKPIFVLFALSVATTIYTNLDVVMLRVMTNSQEVGYYDAVVKVKNLMVILVTSLGTVLLPRISYYVKTNQQPEYLKLLNKSFRFVCLTALPLCFYFIIMAKETISFIFGNHYLNAVPAARLILPTVLLIGLTNVIGIQMLVPLGKEKLVVYSTCAGAAVDVMLNALLIPRFRCSGAAAGTLAAEITVLLVQLWYIRTWFPYFKGALPIKKVLIALIPSCFLLIALCQFLHTSTLFMLCATSLAFFTVYGGCLLLLKCRLSP
ncbi:MAG: flippase [Lachnospiraceae bacterium]|nr:flippase [Lachnospiraceae bacterium]